MEANMTNETRDIEAFGRQIAELKIEVSKDENGLLTVCSTTEPLFCYDAHSEEEVETLVTDTLRSYAKHFFNIDGLGIHTKSEPIPQPPLPIERGTPVSRVLPVFDLAA